MPIDIDAVVPIETGSALEGTGESGTPLNVTDNGITSVKIAGGAVVEAKIGSNAVTTDKIASNAVVEGKIASDAVVEAKIADNAVTTDKIADSAVTLPKLSGAGASDGDGIYWNNTAGEFEVGAPPSGGSSRAFVSGANYVGIATGAGITVALNTPGITITIPPGTWPHSLRIPFDNTNQTDAGGELDITITQAGASREQLESWIPEARVINDQTSGNGVGDTLAIDIIQSVATGSIVFRLTDASTIAPNPILILQFP